MTYLTQILRLERPLTLSGKECILWETESRTSPRPPPEEEGQGGPHFSPPPPCGRETVRPRGWEDLRGCHTSTLLPPFMEHDGPVTQEESPHNDGESDYN